MRCVDLRISDPTNCLLVVKLRRLVYGWIVLDVASVGRPFEHSPAPRLLVEALRLRRIYGRRDTGLARVTLLWPRVILKKRPL
jgi:hypothetical protein